MTLNSIRELSALLVLICFSGCRTETINVSLSFRDDKHIINTDRGRLLIIDNPNASCLSLQQSFENSVEVEGIVVDEDRDMCDFISGFEVPEWPEGLFTAVFYGYNVGSSQMSLFACLRQVEDAISFPVVTPVEGYDQARPARCTTVPIRCSGDPCGNY